MNYLQVFGVLRDDEALCPRCGAYWRPCGCEALRRKLEDLAQGYVERWNNHIMDSIQRDIDAVGGLDSPGGRELLRRYKDTP